MLLSTKFPLVLRFQINDQQNLKAFRVAGTEITIKCGLAAVRIVGEGLCL